MAIKSKNEGPLHNRRGSPPSQRPRRLSEGLQQRIRDLGLRPALRQTVERVFTADDYPKIMSLSTELVVNPIWRQLPIAKRTSMARTFSPFGDLAPRIMHLDIFLIRADDNEERPLLFTYFSGKPLSGWNAFLLPFRHKQRPETAPGRQAASEADIAAFLGTNSNNVHVQSLGEEFVVSIKPDPGYTELVAYIFEFCGVRFDIPPRWLKTIECEMNLERSVRRFRWFHPEEMEQDQSMKLVDGDVLRAVHYFFGTTLSGIPASVPSGFLA